MINNDTNQSDEPCQDWTGNGVSLVKAMNRWEDKVGLITAERGGHYKSDARYPWRLSKANLDKNFDKRHEWRQDQFKGSMVNDVNVFKTIYSNSLRQVAILEKKIDKKEIDKEEKAEYKAGVLWIKDYRRRVQNENRQKRRQRRAGS